MKKLIVAFLLVFASTAHAQWWAGDEAHPENFQRMAPVDMLEPYREYRQKKIYETWWREIAECEGLELPGSYKQVRFFHVNGRAFMPAEYPVWLDGLTYPKIGRIYVATPYIFSEALVKHEMLHWILWALGYRLTDQHPVEMFEKCGIHIQGP